MSSSTILYKFRSGTTFEALPLPGSAARLFDVKKAIVQAKKLDQSGGGGMEFDLSVRDATTLEEYVDETQLLPRGTRLIVQRLPAAKGHGFLSRLARNPYGGTTTTNSSSTAYQQQHPPSGFFTIQSRVHDEDEEFISSNANTTNNNNNEEMELAALRAATDTANQSSVMGGMRPNISAGRGGGGRGHHHHAQPAGSGPPPRRGGHAGGGNFVPRQRPNADPELREQEKQLLPKKRATGIPRTFLKGPPTSVTDGSNIADGSANGGDSAGTSGGGGGASLLQPNAIGFEELVHRGGGQSETVSGTKRDLEYAIKLTATVVHEYLQCAICHKVVKDAMILPWDPEGRTTCETCIRDSLTKSGFRCPLTGQEGVSPDDLVPNHGLRKAAEQFIKSVMEKMEEIEKQVVDDDEFESGGGQNANGKAGSGVLGDDKGVILSKRTSIADRKKREEEDPFGGEDDFGGDVFAVEAEKAEEEEPTVPVPAPAPTPAPVVEEADPVKVEPKEEEKTDEPVEEEEEAVAVKSDDNIQPNKETSPPTAANTNGSRNKDQSTEKSSSSGRNRSLSPINNEKSPPDGRGSSVDGGVNPSTRRETYRRRGPPVGYSMGPAGGAIGGPRDDSYSPRNGSGGGGDSGSVGGGRSGGDYRGGGGRAYEPRGGRGGRFGRESFGRGRGRGRYVSAGPGRGSYPPLPPQEQHHHNHHQPAVAITTGQSEDDSRGTKRTRSESENHQEEAMATYDNSSQQQQQEQQQQQYGYQGNRYDEHYGRARGRAAATEYGGGRGGRYDGGRGRGNYQGRGRGNYEARGGFARGGPGGRFESRGGGGGGRDFRGGRGRGGYRGGGRGDGGRY